ncbi:MAG TPA: HAD family hydrolase [Dermatophilaceae bacterium]|nr:HAD family hydrolase [Dermatophilaceae bacterium]
MSGIPALPEPPEPAALSGLPVVPIDGVILDYHSTLAHGGDPAGWVADAWTILGRPGSPADSLTGRYAALLAFLDRIWEHASRLDPTGERDLDPARHREVYDATVAGQSALAADPELADALYRTLLDQWTAYADTEPMLRGLRAAGVRTVVLSNMGLELAPVLERQGIAGLVDGVLMSWQVGAVKPRRSAFEAALAVLGLPAERVLMVGDNHVDDAGAVALGIRTLLLPRTDGAAHGLGVVLELVRATRR